MGNVCKVEGPAKENVKGDWMNFLPHSIWANTNNTKHTTMHVSANALTLRRVKPT